MIEFAQHQKDAIAFQQVHENSICAMQTGTGKSATTIGSELVNLQQKKLDKCIFVCTKGSIGEVLNDYNKFFNFQPMQLWDQNALFEFFNSDKTVAVTRYEWLKYFDEDFCKMHILGQNLGLWWDEAQKLKNTGTIAHKNAKLLRRYSKSFHLVTATPIMTKLDDLWGLMSLVDANVLGSFDDFSDNYYEKVLAPHPKYSRKMKRKCPTCGCKMQFLSTGWNVCTNPYCRSIQTPMGFVPYKEKVRCIWDLIEYKNLDILSKTLQPYMFCFYPEQDINYILHRFDLANDTVEDYKKAAKGVFDSKNSDDISFATRMIELQYVVDRSYEKKKKLHKLATQLKDKGFVLYVSLYNSIGFNNTNTTLEDVQKVLDTVENLEYRTYSGKESDSERDDNKSWFQADPKNKCLIITEAGGASLNLQVTNEFIFYNLPAGFGKMSQAFGRVVRLFSTFKTFNIHFILGSHTIDDYKYAGFLMYEELMKKLLNNKLINTSKPISFNNFVKAEMRKDTCWNY